MHARLRLSGFPRPPGTRGRLVDATQLTGGSGGLGGRGIAGSLIEARLKATVEPDSLGRHLKHDHLNDRLLHRSLLDTSELLLLPEGAEQTRPGHNPALLMSAGGRREDLLAGFEHRWAACTTGTSAAGNSRWFILGCLLAHPLPSPSCSTAHDAQTSGWVINTLVMFGLALAFFGGCCCVASDAPALGRHWAHPRWCRIQEVGGAEIRHLPAAGVRTPGRRCRPSRSRA